MSDLIYVAKLGKTVGLKGQLKLYIESDFPAQFKAGSKFITNKKIELQIESFNSQNNVVKFVGIDDIDKAKKLVTQQLFSTLEQTRTQCELKNNEFFWFDIIGCKVYENELYLGEVIEIHRFPITDYLEIKTSKELVAQNLPKNFLIPYNESFVINVDLSLKTIQAQSSYDILLNS